MSMPASPPKLTPEQSQALATVLEMTVYDGDKAVEIILKPAKYVRDMGLSEKDVANIVAYGNYVWNKAMLEIMEEWEKDQE